MAIKSVTSANLTEYVTERKNLGHPVATPEQVAAAEVTAAAKVIAETPNKGDAEGSGDSKIVAAVTETVSTAPEPQGDRTAAQAQAEKKDKSKNPVQARIDELTREKKELEEFAEGEYTGRVQAQRQIADLEAQIQALKPKEAPKPEDPEPDSAKYTDQAAFLKDWGAWNRKKAISEFQASETQRRAQEESQRVTVELNSRREKSVAAARASLPDFDEVIKTADRTGPVPPPELVKSAIWESEHGAQIMYHLAKNPEEARTIFQMRPGAAIMALGRIEAQYAKGKTPVAAETTAAKVEPAVQEPTIVPPTSKAPAPMPSLTSGAGDAPIDLSKPIAFKDYKTKRIEEIRRKRAH